MNVLLTEDCSLPDSTTSLKLFLDVISDKDSISQVDRQVILLEMFLSATGDSVYISDLQLLAKTILFLVSREEFEIRYRKPLQRILDILKQPPQVERSSDVLNHKTNLIEFFNTLGSLLIQKEKGEIMPQFLDIILKILLTERTGQLHLVPAKVCIHALEISELMECLCDLISIVNESMYHRTLFTTQQICAVSDFCCWSLLSKNIIDSLLVRLSTIWISERSVVIDTTSQLLWRLFNSTNHPEDWSKVPIPTKTGLRSLRYVLREEGLVNIENFKNMGALTLKIMHLFPNADYVLSGITEDIIFYATMTEAKIALHILPHFKNQHDHMQFKKLMLACTALIPITSASIQLFLYFRVPKCLVNMISGNTDGSCCSIQWTSELELDLFESALHCICALFDSQHVEFIKAGLMKVLVKFFRVRCAQTNICLDNLANKVITAIMSMCFNKNSSTATRDAFREAGLIEVLLTICENAMISGSALTIRAQSVLSISLCVLSSLMANQKEILSTFSDRCLQLISTLYQRIKCPLPSDSLMDKRLIVSVSNFAWETLVCRHDMGLQFIKSGNVFTHIDILEKSAFPVQMAFLSMLVDLCENAHIIPYLVTWRGKEGSKLLNVLCRVWRAEEKRIHVPRNEQNIITDLDRPLMGEVQFELAKRTSDRIVSICDVFGSVRPKIYAIVQLLHRHKEVVDICEKHYGLGYNKVPHEDQVTLQLIEAYLPLKMGEIWWEIRQKQVTERVQPLDIYLANTLAERYHDWALRVQRSQQAIVQDQEACIRAEEREYYSLIRATRLTPALGALREVVAIARSADRELLLRSQRKLREGIEASRATVNVDLRVAYPSDINVILVNSKIDVANSSNA